MLVCIISISKFAQGLGRVMAVIRHFWVLHRLGLRGPKQCYLPHRSHLGLEMASPASWACQPGLWPASRGLPAWPRACQPCQESLSGCHLGLPAGSTSLSAALPRLFSGPASLTPELAPRPWPPGPASLPPRPDIWAYQSATWPCQPAAGPASLPPVSPGSQDRPHEYSPQTLPATRASSQEVRIHRGGEADGRGRGSQTCHKSQLHPTLPQKP